MVNAMNGMRGASGPERVPSKRQVENKAPALSTKDSIELSKNAVAAKAVGRYVQFVKNLPDVRAESVKQARVDLAGEILFSDDTTAKLADKVIENSTQL